MFLLRFTSFPPTLDFKTTTALRVGERLLEDVMDTDDESDEESDDVGDDAGDGENDDGADGVAIAHCLQVNEHCCFTCVYLQCPAY